MLTKIDDTFEEQPTYHQQVSYVTKQQSYYKYPIILTSIWILIPAFYCFDQPVALYTQLRQHLDTEHFAYYFIALYLLYAFSNAILPLLTGGLRDCKGDRLVLNFLVVSAIVGQIIFAYGVQSRHIGSMILGRVFLGWGVESLLPIITSYLSPYFKDYISIVLSLLQLSCQFGLVLSIYLTPLIYEHYSMFITLMTGAGALFIGFIMLQVSFYLDRQVEQLRHGSYRLANTSEIIMFEETIEKPDYLFKFNDFQGYPYMFWLLLTFNSILYCSIVTLVNVSMYVIASLLANTDNQFASIDIALFWMLGSLALVFLGVVVHYVKRRRYHIVASVILVMIGHVQYVTTPQSGLIILAFGFSLAFVSTWSSIIHIIKMQAFGKAFGLIVCFQNMSFLFMPFLLDAVNKRYLGTTKVLLGLSLLALVVAIQIIVEDINKCGMLDRKAVPVSNRNHKQQNSNEEYQHLSDTFAAVYH